MSIPFYSNLNLNENEIENAKGGTNTSASVSKIYLAQGTSGSSTFTIDDPELNVVDGTVIYAYTDRSNESLYGGFSLKINGEIYYVYFKTNADTLEDNYLIARTVYQFILDKTNHKAFLIGGYICNIADMYRPGLVTLDQTLKTSWSSAPATAAVYNAVNGLQTSINNLAAKQASSTELGLVKIGNGLSISTDGILSAAEGSSEITTILEADFATPKGLWEYDEGLYYVKCYYFNCYTSKANMTNKQVTMFTGPCWIVIDNASSMSYSKRVSVYAGDEVFYCAYNSLGGPSANQFDFKYTNYLAKDNTSVYTPTDDYHPATKAYVDSKFQEEIAIDIFFITQMPDGNDCTEYFDRKRFQKVLNMETKDVLLVRPSGTGSDGMWYYKVMSISSWTNNAGLPVLNFTYIDTYSSEPTIQTLSFCLDAENEIVYKGQNGPN